MFDHQTFQFGTRQLLIVLLLLVLSGCATHANIEIPKFDAVVSDAYIGKTLKTDIFYTQPKPGVFSGGEEMPLKPLEEAELSVAAQETMAELKDYIESQFPAGIISLGQEGSDLQLEVALYAYNKGGPVYYDYLFGKSLAKSLLTFGFAPSDWRLHAEFLVKYSLTGQGSEALTREYRVNDAVDTQKGDFEDLSVLSSGAKQLFEKHIKLTLNEFFSEASDLRESQDVLADSAPK